jgi:plasmid stabilization system protein ParE
MANYKVIINKTGLNDLEGIYRYFSNQLLTPTTAAKTVKHIEDEIRKNLSYMPYYPLVDDDHIVSMGIHKMVVKKYLVFLIIDEEKEIVNVIRIIHGARDWKRLLPE